MFGRQKKEEREELNNFLAELRQNLKHDQEVQVEALREQKDMLNGQADMLRMLEQEVSAGREQTDLLGRDMERQLKRHSEAIEDLLEEQKSQETVIEHYEHQIKEAGERENLLLTLLCHYQEEFGLIEEKLRNMDEQHAEDWSAQLALFKKSMADEMRQCAIEETGAKGEPVDYRYHEILDTEDADQPELEGRVAYCYRPGCIYHGRVVTKAQVRAYKTRR